MERAASKIVRAAMFELRDDSRPAIKRTAARRYLEPSLFTLLDAKGFCVPLERAAFLGNQDFRIGDALIQDMRRREAGAHDTTLL